MDRMIVLLCRSNQASISLAMDSMQLGMKQFKSPEYALEVGSAQPYSTSEQNLMLGGGLLGQSWADHVAGGISAQNQNDSNLYRL